MAVGITTTDGKDLDDRYIRTLNGSGPDADGNVVAPPPPVLSVQGATGDVLLRLTTNPNPVSMTHSMTNGETYNYTVPATGIATFYARLGRARDYGNTASGEDVSYNCYSRNENQRVQVKYNGTVLFDQTSKNDIAFTKSDFAVTKGDVISTYMSMQWNYDSYCSRDHVCGLNMDALEIVGYN